MTPSAHSSPWPALLEPRISRNSWKAAERKGCYYPAGANQAIGGCAAGVFQPRLTTEPQRTRVPKATPDRLPLPPLPCQPGRAQCVTRARCIHSSGPAPEAPGRRQRAGHGPGPAALPPAELAHRPPPPFRAGPRRRRAEMAAVVPGASRARAAALLLLLLGCCGAALPGGLQDQAEQFFRSGHTNNWAVLVCTSRFWFNYRHVANTLSVYRSVKRLGIPDSHIVLMLADDMACNPRNPKPATVFSHKNMELNVYGDDVEVDYRSYEVTVENFLRVLTGRIPPSTPRSKRLLSDDRSNILIYMTGHGGNGFLKFQDSEEITNVELADAFEQMWQKRRYNELLFIIDTCQGASMYERFYSPNIMALASSQVGEDSLSHQPDLGIGVHLMDRYTFYVLEFLEEIHPASQTNMNDLFQVCPKSLCVSTPGHRTDLFQRDPQNVLITDFFGSVRKVEITAETLSLDRDVPGLESKFPEEELATEPLKYAEQLPVAQIIHQKPKQKDWHPPGGFILGLWALIIMVFFKTYGIKHMKHVF
ncbi:GPI-anchor transamidase isoform X1 [Agelaius phoeniceus]|uniref:GPI-anchor transamidase isoform X1 n=1 Tax=Agelaius phoeniceus TaxID=39638 RepID=UPI004054DA77